MVDIYTITTSQRPLPCFLHLTYYGQSKYLEYASTPHDRTTNMEATTHIIRGVEGADPLISQPKPNQAIRDSGSSGMVGFLLVDRGVSFVMACLLDSIGT